MSLFDDDNAKVKKIINYFNSLLESEKMTVVNDLNPNTSNLKLPFGDLVPLWSEVREDIAKHDEFKIVNKLFEFGLDKTYARLFVSNVKKYVSTEEYQLSQINKIDDGEFPILLDYVLDNIQADPNDLHIVVEKTSINNEQLYCTIAFIRKLINTPGFKGIAPKLIKEKCVGKLSDKKLEVLDAWSLDC